MRRPTNEPGVKLLAYGERRKRYESHSTAHATARTIYDTPYLRDFVMRADVTSLRFKSGAYHVFVGDHGFVGDTWLAAVELAAAWDQRNDGRNTLQPGATS